MVLHSERVKYADLIDGAVETWISERPRSEVMKIAEKMQVTLAPMNDVEEVYNDEHIRKAGFLTEVKDDDLGSMLMPNVLFKLSATPGEIRWTGPALGEATSDISRGELEVPEARLEALRNRKSIR